MTARNHFIFWSATSVLFLLFIYVFKAVLLPFVLGLAIAYLLNPLVNRLGKIGLARGAASLSILGIFLLCLIVFIAAFGPLAYRELLQFLDDLPGYVDHIWGVVQPLSKKVQGFTGASDVDGIKDLLKDHIGTAVNIGKKLAGGLWSGGQALIGLFSVLVITPIVSYFMMKEWPNIAKWVDDLMPREQKQTITDLLEQIDKKLSGFIRGQISVALVLGIAYALALSLAGLKYGFLIGMFSGLLSIIPMVGSTLGLLISVLVAWVQAGEWSFVAIVAAIFLIGQFLEGNVLTPKLVGNSVGLHPLWVFFSLLAGGALFGILGMFLAVPVAAVIGVLAAFAIAQYKASAYYKGKTKTKSAAKKNNNDE